MAKSIPPKCQKCATEGMLQPSTIAAASEDGSIMLDVLFVEDLKLKKLTRRAKAKID